MSDQQTTYLENNRRERNPTLVLEVELDMVVGPETTKDESGDQTKRSRVDDLI